MPTDAQLAEKCKKTFAEIVQEHGLNLIGWREVPIDPDKADVGPTARGSMPQIEQIFIGKPEELSQSEFRRRLYLVQKRTSHALRTIDHPQALQFYICSLSTGIIVYKGMLSTHQLGAILRRPFQRKLQVPFGDGPLAVFDEYVPELGPGSTSAQHGPQR